MDDDGQQFEPWDADDADSAEDETDHLLGKLVAGRFFVEGLLGVGGMGRVYRAQQVDLGRAVALKVLHPHTAARPGMKQLFHREAKAASMLQHPNSVMVHDFGEWEGQLYIAMEFLSGEPLSDILRREGALPTERIKGIMEQLLDVLEVAHGQDLLHRDLKPENLLVLPDPRASVADHGGFKDYVKVVDFGLARTMDPESDMRLSQEGDVSGTPVYMSPEQARGVELDCRSDLYSVGVLLYEMLCGEVPFGGDAPLDVMLKHLYREPVAPSERAPQTKVSRALEAVCLRALMKAPDDRYDSAAQMRQEVAAAGGIDGLVGAPSEVAIKRAPRAERASIVGLTDMGARKSRPGDAPALQIVVVQPRGLAFATSSAAALSAGGNQVVELNDLDAFAAYDGVYDGVVIDLRPDASVALTAIEEGMAAWGLAGRPLLLLGPNDDFDVMHRALAAGVSDFVPLSKMTKVPKIMRRAVRRYRRQH